MKRSIIQRTAAGLLCLLLLLCAPAAALLPAAAVPDLPEPSLDAARVACLYRVNDDKILLQKGLDDPIFPSSAVKIMSGLVAVELLSSRLDDEVTVHDSMRMNIVGNDFALREGNVLTVRDLLYLGWCGCYHDAISIVEHIAAGSPEQFVALMNQKAEALGMTATHYTNATGVTDESGKMVSTGRDTLRLAAEAARSKLFMTITSTVEYTPEGLKNYTNPSFLNRNYLISKRDNTAYVNPLCQGMNAGMNSVGECNLVTLAQKDGVSYLIVILGALRPDAGIYPSYEMAGQMIDWAFASFGEVTLLSGSEIMGELPVSLGQDADSVLVVPAEAVTVFGELSLAGNNVRVRVSPKLTVSSLTAPVAAGTRVGNVTVLIDGKEYRTVPLVTRSGIARSPLDYFFSRITSFARSRFFIAFVVSLAVYGTAALIIRSAGKDKNKRSRGIIK